MRPEITLDQLNSFQKGTLLETLDIQFTEIGENFLKATMPVGPKVHQPMGLLHGGATVALAETLGSVASFIYVNDPSRSCVGVEINANHVRSVKSGTVTGIVSPINLGKSLHVWDIRIHNENDQLVSVCRLTVAVIERKK